MAGKGSESDVGTQDGPVRPAPASDAGAPAQLSHVSHDADDNAAIDAGVNSHVEPDATAPVVADGAVDDPVSTPVPQESAAPADGQPPQGPEDGVRRRPGPIRDRGQPQPELGERDAGGAQHLVDVIPP